MAEEYRIEIRVSAEELVQLGNAITTVCFFPKFVHSEVQRLGFRSGVR